MLAASASPDSWFTVALALLNVLQTVALAYLAASRHVEKHQGDDTSTR